MPIERGPIDFWREFEDELASRSEGRYSLSPVRAADTEWLRRAEPSPEVEEALVRTLRQHGCHFHHVIVQGTRCTTSEDLLRTLGDALEFPGYYGANWGALHECLYELLILSDDGLGSYYGDRVGRRERALVITVADAEHLLEQEPHRIFESFLNLLRFSASEPVDPVDRTVPRGQLFVLLSVDPTTPPGPNYHLVT
jgi:barstar (barnase inhibitor)